MYIRCINAGFVERHGLSTYTTTSQERHNQNLFPEY